MQQLQGLDVEHLNRVVIAGANEQVLAVLGNGDAARALADIEGLDSAFIVSVSITVTVLSFSLVT